MTEKQLLHALQTADPKYTAEAAERAAHAVKPRISRIAPIVLTTAGAAACLAFAVTTMQAGDNDSMLIANSNINDEMLAEQNEAESAADVEQAFSAVTTTWLTQNTDSFASKSNAANQKGSISEIVAENNDSGKNQNADSSSKSSKQTTAAGKTDAKSTTTTALDAEVNVIQLVERNSYVTVPDFTNKSWTEAQKLAKSLGLTLTRQIRVSPLPKDTVIEQMTSKGRKVPVGTPLEVETASGGNEVALCFDIPADKQKLWDDFEIMLYDSNTNQPYADNSKGTLLDYPRSGYYGYSLNPSHLESHVMEIDLVGTGTVDITAVMQNGYFEPFATKLDLDKQTDYALVGKYHIDYDKKTITTLSEDIAGAFKQFERKETPSDIFTIPNFIGMTLEEAKQVAAESPLDLSIYTENVTSDQPVGTVVAQTPEAGMESRVGYRASNKVVVLSISVGAQTEIMFELPHTDLLEKYPFMDYFPYVANEYPIRNPLDGLVVYLYPLDQNGNRDGKPNAAYEYCGFRDRVWGSGVKDYEAVMKNLKTKDTKTIGTYRFDFNNQSFTLLNGDIEAAYQAVTAPLPNLVNMSWEDASALAAQAGFELQKVEVSSAAPAGTIIYQPFDAGELIAKGNIIPVEVSYGNGDWKRICFELTVPTTYSGNYSIVPYKESDKEYDDSYLIQLIEFDPSQSDGKVQITFSGYGQGDFKMMLIKDDQTANLGIFRIDFENQTVEIIENNIIEAFETVNAK